MTPPDSAPSARREHASEPERAPGWYVVNDNDGGRVFNGPYQHLETASTKRDDRERRATDDQSERWNLSIRWLGDPSKKIMPSRYDACVAALADVFDPAAMLEELRKLLQEIADFGGECAHTANKALALLPPIRTDILGSFAAPQPAADSHAPSA